MLLVSLGYTSAVHLFRLGATVSILQQRTVGEGEGERRVVTEVLVRKVPDDQQVSGYYFY